MKKARRPNFLVILVDDLRYDEFGAGGHPYMKTPHVDRLAHEGMLFERAFHTTPICSPNRASILTGQYASRHGIIDNVARDAMSHRLPNYHLDLQRLGYATAHIGKWHMGNDGMPRPGYDTWVSYDGHGRIVDPRLNHDGTYVEHRGYITDLMNAMALEWIERRHKGPWSLFLAHKAVHPDAEQAADGTVKFFGGYIAAERHRHLYEGAVYPKKPNMRPPEEVVVAKPAWKEIFALRATEGSRKVLESNPGGHAGRDPPARAHDGGGGRGGGRDARGRSSAPGSSTTRSSSFSATTAISSASTAWGPSGALPTRKASARPSSCAIRGACAPAAASGGSSSARTSRRIVRRARRRPPRSAGPGALAPSALRGPARALALVVPHRILVRAGLSLARRHELQGGAHRSLTSTG
ncbi:MAG: sulfatase-like hydrolase/transferase [Burkholderiales bacterium]|nr:sulfatase-like hydrolase/transferase [Burkholderiales bacterium]